MSEEQASVPSQTRRASEVNNWDEEADIVIIGMGGAGACAAIEARHAGADVLVLERAGGPGGTTAASDGMMYFGGGTALQRACGFEDSPDDMYDYLMAACGPQPLEERIRVYCDESPAHYDWLVDQGIPFKAEFYDQRMLAPEEQGLTYSGNELVYPFRDIAKPAPRAHMAAKEGMTGAFLMQLLSERAESLGARILNNTRADALVQDDNRRVIGAVATVAGKERTIKANKGVILCAGGFAVNKEMINKYAPELRKARFKAATDGDDGLGLRIGIAAGGNPIRMNMASVTLPFYPPKTLMKGIFVNQAGQRFMPEDVYQGRAGEICFYQQDAKVFLILDDETFERPMFAGGEIHAAETVAELEEELGMAEGTLQATVEIYNKFAAEGSDPVFHKADDYVQPIVKSPFGAIDMSWDKAVYAAFTLGGLDTDVHGRVRNADGDPIPSLYAAGRTAASISSPGSSSGTSIGEATFFGRRAGRAAAED
ncbi:MAG: FAD-dependent oxidoreductase [Myxococcota bacterium]|nr:FAD-dependent oxidoreductase [Myxococcota bacterium]